MSDGVGRGLRNLSVRALAIDPRNSNALYAATTEGVFSSLDGGTSFTPFNSGLTHLSVSLLLIDPSGRSLHAGTSTGGVFDYELLPKRLPLSLPARRAPVRGERDRP